MENNNQAKEQARCQLDSIIEMMNDLYSALEKERDCDAVEDASQAIQEDPLSIEIRSDWHAPEAQAVFEFRILLFFPTGTGGRPAVQIVGYLDEYNTPESATLQYQDWFTKWENFVDIEGDEQNALLEYCQQFYFGE